jgi:BirA family biotin operon repressor/biotin-[acetyl-CoA-carboxylase] ligase
MTKEATFADVDERRPIDVTALHATAGARWARVVVVDSTASTNADLLADEQAPDRSVLVAEVQTAGRGRLERTWSSPAGSGLTFSVLLRPNAPVHTWSWLPLLAGVALHDAVRPFADVALKWPNDLVAADGGKLAGILAQTAGDAVVVGIGVNVGMTRAELPVPTATSLALAGSAPDRTELLALILDALATRYAQFVAAGGAADTSGLGAAYRAACATLGRDVVVETPSGRIAGRAIDIDASGQLVVRSGSEVRSLAVGDVTQVRADGGQTRR